MKKLLTAVLLVLPIAGCLSAPSMIETEGPVGRSIERVLDRHDAYVDADPAAAPEAIGESAMARAMLTYPEVNGGMLGNAMDPCMDRHDAYVLLDSLLEDLERQTYLATTERLRALLGLFEPDSQ